jgi:hypothetical protein
MDTMAQENAKIGQNNQINHPHKWIFHQQQKGRLLEAKDSLCLNREQQKKRMLKTTMKKGGGKEEQEESAADGQLETTDLRAFKDGSGEMEEDEEGKEGGGGGGEENIAMVISRKRLQFKIGLPEEEEEKVRGEGGGGKGNATLPV